MYFIEILKSIFFGIVEGITEWLPISSTGHLILVEEFVQYKDQNEAFMSMFNVVIQLGASLILSNLVKLRSKFVELGNCGQKSWLRPCLCYWFLN